MKFKATATPSDLSTLSSDCLVVPVYTDKPFSKAVKALDKGLNGVLGKICKNGDFSAETGQFMLLPLANDKKLLRIALLGCGKSKGAKAANYRQAIASLAKALNKSALKSPHILLSEFGDVDGYSEAQQIQDIACQCISSSYKYDTTLSKKNSKPTLLQINLLILDGKGSANAIRTGKAVGEGLNAAKQLGNLPGNICTPRFLASTAKKLATKQNKLTTTILDDKKLENLGMGSLLSVAKGSKEPARLICMEYKGAAAATAPIVLVGKGITFDTGGISLKPGAAMDEMKFDMCGAASVFGVITALLSMNAKVNVVGIVAAAENMPSSQATKPGDVVTSMAGKTIEVLNTDAEGRLVLCDALTYAERYKPKAVVDIATLTGAVIIALGHHATGLFSNNDDLAAKLQAAGNSTGDRVWQLPIWDEYQKQLDSNFADLANIGGRSAGSITAACFLSQFAEKYPWAHLDIAGTAWQSGANKAATGKPVELLVEFLLS